MIWSSIFFKPHTHSSKRYTWYSQELDVADIPAGFDYDAKITQDCLETIHDYINQNGIDVLLCFSQGGNVVDTYLHQYSDNPIQRVLIFSGYEFRYPERRTLNLPLVSVYSDVDDVVPSTCRPTNYSVIHEYAHDKGHKFPSGNPLLRKFCKFMQTGEWQGEEQS